MCGSQNVSGPEIAGPGVGVAQAAAAATSQGTGGHGAPAPELSVGWAGKAVDTADPKEQIAGPGIVAAHAEAAAAAATPKGTGGHYSGTREETLSFEHGLRRMGINRREVRTSITSISICFVCLMLADFFPLAC